MGFLQTFTYFLFVSFLISLTVYGRPVKQYPQLRWFPPYLFLTLAAEMTAQYINAQGDSNVVIYNLFSFFEICFYLWFVSRIVENSKARRNMLWILAGYIVVGLVNMFLVQKVHTFHSNSYCLGCLVIVSFTIYYFLEIFRSTKRGSVARLPFFWICTGLLFYYACSFPFFGSIFVWTNAPDIFLDNMLLIIDILNIVLYSLFAIGFLCARERKYTSSSS